MAIPSDTYVLWITAVSYMVAAGFLVWKIRKEGNAILYPISAYLFAIAAFFTLLGFSKIFNSTLIILFASLSVFIGASTIARLPLKMLYPKREKSLYSILLIIGLIIALYAYSTGENQIMLVAANSYAFVLAGVFTIGYIFYIGIKKKHKRYDSFATGGSLGLCCVVAHGLAATQMYYPAVTISLLGLANVGVPMAFAILAPFAFIYVLVIDQIIRPEVSET